MTIPPNLTSGDVTDDEIRRSILVAVDELDLYIRLAVARGIVVTLDLVERRSIWCPDGYTSVIWSDGK